MLEFKYEIKSHIMWKLANWVTYKQEKLRLITLMFWIEVMSNSFVVLARVLSQIAQQVVSEPMVHLDNWLKWVLYHTWGVNCWSLNRVEVSHCVEMDKLNNINKKDPQTYSIEVELKVMSSSHVISSWLIGEDLFVVFSLLFEYDFY